MEVKKYQVYSEVTELKSEKDIEYLENYFELGDNFIHQYVHYTCQLFNNDLGLWQFKEIIDSIHILRRSISAVNLTKEDYYGVNVYYGSGGEVHFIFNEIEQAKYYHSIILNWYLNEQEESKAIKESSDTNY